MGRSRTAVTVTASAMTESPAPFCHMSANTTWPGMAQMKPMVKRLGSKPKSRLLVKAPKPMNAQPMTSPARHTALRMPSEKPPPIVAVRPLVIHGRVWR